MKVQCEVCSVEAASVFCCAEEAPFCDSCDRLVHRGNRLAGEHHRFSLLHPSSPALPPPLCDVCKEKRGFLFCREDRAILCRDCDLPIHSATALTGKHSRFLLTGARLSAAPLTSSPAAAEAEVADSSIHGGSNAEANSSGSGSSSSIAEYLIKTLPGWHVEDFLVDDATTHAFCKTEEAEQFYRTNTSNSSMSNGIEGAGLEEMEMEMEMKASSNIKRPRISVRFL